MPCLGELSNGRSNQHQLRKPSRSENWRIIQLPANSRNSPCSWMSQFVFCPKPDQPQQTGNDPQQAEALTGRGFSPLRRRASRRGPKKNLSHSLVALGRRTALSVRSTDAGRFELTSRSNPCLTQPALETVQARRAGIFDSARPPLPIHDRRYTIPSQSRGVHGELRRPWTFQPSNRDTNSVTGVTLRSSEDDCR